MSKKSTKRHIITLPNANLRKKSSSVDKTTDSVKKLIDDMKNLTLEWEDSREHEVGVALAAIQVNAHKDIVIIRSDFEDKANREFDVYINPKVTKLDGDLVEDYEGCLSIKDIYGKVPRREIAHIKAKGPDGKVKKLVARGFLARVFQHEIDHTKGLLFIDHIKHNPKAFYHLESDGHLTELNYEKDIKNNKDLWND